jgi:polysaccharide biosynthesis protein PslH
MNHKLPNSRSAAPQRRPRLLFVAQTLPYPPDGGVKIRTYNILRLLARSFDISVLCFYRREGGVTGAELDASVAALNKLADVRALPIPQEHSRTRLLWDHFRSLITGRVYTVFSYESRRFREALTSLLAAQEFDLVHADSLDLSGYFPALGSLPLICTHHDATSVQLRRRAEQEDSRVRAAYIRRQSKLMAREEARWCGRVDANIVVSETDYETFRGLAPHGRFIVVPNGVDTDYFKPSAAPCEGIICVGSTGWFPNRDALEHLAHDILPALRARGRDPAVRWVGLATAEDQQHYGERHRIELTGRVPDIRPHVASAACYVVPLRVGGGTRVKILDAWAMGKAVVSTSIGCEGLDAVEGVNILIRDDPAEFAAAVEEVLADCELRARLGASARRTVETKYSWEVIAESLMEQYQALMARDITMVGSATTVSMTSSP